jgi:hypothetical protein
MGDVGCRLLSQKYWFTGIPHEGSRVSGAGVPLDTISNISIKRGNV